MNGTTSLYQVARDKEAEGWGEEGRAEDLWSNDMAMMHLDIGSSSPGN